jgi:polar amino acid transport system permease protein
MPFTPETLQMLVNGVGVTILLTLISSILSMSVGLGIGTMRLTDRPVLQRAAAIYVDIFRNIPALVLIIFFAFAVPNLAPLEMRQALFFDNALADWAQQVTGLSLPYYAFAAAIGLTLNTSAYLAELFRAGVGTIPQNVLDSARSLGATAAVAFWQVLLPQGVRAAFPAISTRLIHNMKNTALAALVAVPEFFQATQTAITRSFRALEFLLIAAGVYLMLSFTFSAILRQIDRRLRQAPL